MFFKWNISCLHGIVYTFPKNRIEVEIKTAIVHRALIELPTNPTWVMLFALLICWAGYYGNRACLNYIKLNCAENFTSERVYKYTCFTVK